MYFSGRAYAVWGGGFVCCVGKGRIAKQALHSLFCQNASLKITVLSLTVPVRGLRFAFQAPYTKGAQVSFGAQAFASQSKYIRLLFMIIYTDFVRAT